MTDLVSISELTTGLRLEGSATAYLEGFAIEFIAAGYARLTVKAYLRSAAHLGMWLKCRKRDFADFNLQDLEQFNGHSCQCPGYSGYKKQRCGKYAARVGRFVAYLQRVGVVKLPTNPKCPPVPAPLVGFSLWLRCNRGVKPRTIDKYVKLVVRLLPKLGDNPSSYTVSRIRRSLLQTIRPLGLCGTRDAPGTSFALSGPVLAQLKKDQLEAFLPFPADLGWKRQTPIGMGQRSKPSSGVRPIQAPEPILLSPRWLSNHTHEVRRFRWAEGALKPAPEPFLLWSPQGIEKPGAPRLLGAQATAEYLKETAPNPDGLVLEEELSPLETRVDIARDESLTARDGMFYITRTYRLAPEVGIAVEVSCKDEPTRTRLAGLEGRALPQGGRGHRAVVRSVDGSITSASITHPTDGRLKLWLLSPAPLELLRSLERVAGATRSGLVGTRGTPIGGFDFARRQPRSLEHAAPAGSVLFLKDVSKPHHLFQPRVTLAESLEAASAAQLRAGYGSFLISHWSEG